MTSRDMRQDREADSGKTPHYSKYREKSEKKENSQQGLLEKTTPNNQKPQKTENYPLGEKFESPTHRVSIYINYENKNERNNAMLYVKARKYMIDSCSIKPSTHGWRASYKIKKGRDNLEEGSTVIRDNFQELYETSWVENNRSAQVQLHTIEQAIESRRGDIENHLKTGIFI